MAYIIRMQQNLALSSNIPSTAETREAKADFTSWFFSDNGLEDECAVCDRLIRFLFLKHVQVKDDSRVVGNICQVLALKQFLQD